MTLKDWPDAGFPGTAIDPLTLRVEIVDAKACQAALAASHDPADRVLVLLASAATAEAAEAVAEARLADPSSFRLRMLEGRIFSANGEHERAVERLRLLAAEVAGTDQEHLARQQLGHAYFAQGRYAAAVREFSHTLELRVAAGCSAELIYATTVAQRRAMDLADAA